MLGTALGATEAMPSPWERAGRSMLNSEEARVWSVRCNRMKVSLRRCCLLRRVAAASCANMFFQPVSHR